MKTCTAHVCHRAALVSPLGHQSWGNFTSRVIVRWVRRVRFWWHPCPSAQVGQSAPGLGCAARGCSSSILTRIPGAYRPQEQLIAALVPDTVEGRPTPQSVSLPALSVPSLPRLPDSDTLLVGAARVDRSGRIHERTLFSALGWKSGHELEMDTTHGMIAIASVPGGRHRIDNRGALLLPAAARRMCGITLGPPVVLAVAVGEQLLIVHSAATVADLLAMHYATLIGTHDAP